MFSKGLTSRDDVGITLDDLNRKVDRALSEIAEHFATTQKQKSSIDFQIKEIRARLNKHLDDMESMLLNSLESKFRQVEENVSNTIEKLQKGKTEIHHMKTVAKCSAISESALSTFLLRSSNVIPTSSRDVRPFENILTSSSN
jgi:chaperonin cofactor prefoldin